jgi:Amt family ammonium transporter
MAMTAVAGGVSGLAGTLIAYLRADGRRQIDLSTTLNSILAGLVGITANCATVQLEGAFCIGAGSAAVYVYTARLLERCHIDDVVQAVPVRWCRYRLGSPMPRLSSICHSPAPPNVRAQLERNAR